MFALLLLLAIPPVADRLGAPDWVTRDQEEFRFRIWGSAAWDQLARASHSDDAEIRERANRLLVSLTTHTLTTQARAILDSPWPMTDRELTALFLNERLRHWVAEVAIHEGCGRSDTWYLDPLRTTCNFFGTPLNGLLWRSISDCRRKLNRPQVGWPFTEGSNGTDNEN